MISAEASAELTVLCREDGGAGGHHPDGARGSFPASHELCLGMPGMHGHGYTNLALHACDLLMVVGCRLDDRVTGKVDQFVPGRQADRAYRRGLQRDQQNPAQSAVLDLTPMPNPAMSGL